MDGNRPAGLFPSLYCHHFGAARSCEARKPSADCAMGRPEVNARPRLRTLGGTATNGLRILGCEVRLEHRGLPGPPRVREHPDIGTMNLPGPRAQGLICSGRSVHNEWARVRFLRDRQPNAVRRSLAGSDAACRHCLIQRACIRFRDNEGAADWRNSRSSLMPT